MFVSACIRIHMLNTCKLIYMYTSRYLCLCHSVARDLRGVRKEGCVVYRFCFIDPESWA